MSTDYTGLPNELALIRSEGLGAHQRIDAQLLVQEQWVTPMRIDSLTLDRDYEQSYADVRVLSLLLMQGDYVYDILPYRNNIQIDITTTPLLDVGTAQDGTVGSVTRRYRAFIMDTDNAALSSEISNQTSKSQLNHLSPVTIDFQLVEEYIYELQTRAIGGIYRNVTPYDVLKSILTTTMQYVLGSDEKRILGVNLRGTMNERKRTQVLVPHGTRIGQVSKLLQEEEGGISSTGLGCYLQEQYWFVYPLYDLQHGSKGTMESLTVYSVPTDRFEGSERTYRVTPKRIIVVASGAVYSSSQVENAQLQTASGLRFLDTSKILGDFGITDNNRMLVDKASNLFEITPKEILPGVNNIQWSSANSTSNPLAQYSAMARMQGRVVVVEWLHADPSLLTPGMLVEYMVVADNRIESYKGVLLGSHSVSMTPEAGAVVNRHITKTRLKLFIENTKGTEGV